MKKLFILIIALATFAGAQAQWSRTESRARVLGAPRTTVVYPQKRVVVVHPGPRSYRERRYWERRRRAEWYRSHNRWHRHRY